MLEKKTRLVSEGVRGCHRPLGDRSLDYISLATDRLKKKRISGDRVVNISFSSLSLEEIPRKRRCVFLCRASSVRDRSGDNGPTDDGASVRCGRQRTRDARIISPARSPPHAPRDGRTAPHARRRRRRHCTRPGNPGAQSIRAHSRREHFAALGAPNHENAGESLTPFVVSVVVVVVVVVVDIVVFVVI